MIRFGGPTLVVVLGLFAIHTSAPGLLPWHPPIALAAQTATQAVRSAATDPAQNAATPTPMLPNTSVPVTTPPLPSQPLGEAIPVATDTAWQGLPAVAYSIATDNYLVVWEDRRGGTGDLYGRRVTRDGQLLDGEVAISTAPHWQMTPAVAYSPRANQYLVVWGDWRNASTSGEDIYGQRVAADGTLRYQAFAIGIAQDNEQSPTIAYNPAAGEFLVVWEARSNLALDHGDATPAGTTEIRGQRVSDNGLLVGPMLTLSTERAWQGSPKVAYSTRSGRYLVVWANEAGLHGRLVSSSGSMLGAEVVIAATWSGTQAQPALAYNPDLDQFLVAWKDNPGSTATLADTDIYLQAVSVLGERIGEPVRLALPGDQINPAIAYHAAAGEYLIGWADAPDLNGLDIFGMRLNMQLQPATESFVIAVAGLDQSLPAIAYACIETHPSLTPRASSERSDREGECACTEPRHEQSKPGGECDAGEYLVVWQDQRNTPSSSADIYARRIGSP